MITQATTKYKAGASITSPFTGFTVTVQELKIIFIRLYLLKGEVSIITNKSQAQEIVVPKTASPVIEFNSPVSHFGPNGPTINQISFSLTWQGVSITGDGLVLSTVDSFIIMTNQMYAEGYKAFNSLNLTELKKLAKNPKLPAPNTWEGVQNDLLAVASLAPNPLNSKEVEIDSQLPIQFTALANATKDFKNFLAYKIEIKNKMLSAVVEFSTWPLNPKGKPTLLKTYDVTDQLGDSLPFMYFTYWIDAYATDPGQPLDHLLLSIPDSANSTVMSGFVPNPQVVFNVHFKQTYQDSTLTPLYASFGIFPVRKVKQPTLKKITKTKKPK